MNIFEMKWWSYMRRGVRVLVCAMLLRVAQGQTGTAKIDGPELQRRYDAAQRYQAEHELDQAAQQYRIFIADALGEVAIGRAHAGEYDKAADHFDESLRLVPDFPTLQIEYARAALDSGNLEHAKLLATGAIRSSSNDSKTAADAHAVLGRVLLKMHKDGEAKQELEESVELDPTFDHGYELAVADLDSGDSEGAAKIFAEMEASFGDTATIHLQFGQAYLNSDFQADAVGQFQKAIAKDDRIPGLHYSLAAAYLASAGNTKLPEAEAELRKEIAVSPKDAAAYAALGHLLAGQHHDAIEDAEAEGYLKRATELDPKSPDGFLYLGQFYTDLKKPVEAEAALRESIALTTDVSRNDYQVQKAHYLLGRLLMQAGQMDAGKQEIAASQTLMHQNLVKDQHKLSDYLQEKKSEDAGAEAGTQLAMTPMEKPADPEGSRRTDELEKQLGPAIADSYNNLGAITASEGNGRAALPFFEQAAAWNPELPGLDYNWGRAAFAAGDYAQAMGPLSRYLLAHPAEEGARAVLGLSQFMVKDFAAARKTLEPLDGKAGEALQLQYAYAKSLMQTGDTNGGVARMLALEKANPNAAEVHRTLGEAYAAEKAPGAADELEAAIRLNPADGESYVALGRLQLAQGDAKSAVVNLEAAAKLEPGNAALLQELAEAKSKAAQN